MPGAYGRCAGNAVCGPVSLLGCGNEAGDRGNPETYAAPQGCVITCGLLRACGRDPPNPPGIYPFSQDWSRSSRPTRSSGGSTGFRLKQTGVTLQAGGLAIEARIDFVKAAVDFVEPAIHLLSEIM